VRFGSARKAGRAIVGVDERASSERNIVLLANIVLKCVWDSGPESGRNRSRLVDQEVEVNFKSGKLEYSSRSSRDLASVVLDQA